MKTLAVASIIDALNVRTAKQRESLKVAQWLRHNASTVRGLTALPDEGPETMAVLAEEIKNEVTTGQTVGANLNATGGVTATSPPPSDGETGQSAAPSGQVAGGTQSTVTGANQGAASAVGTDLSRFVWARRILPYVLAAVIGASGVGGGSWIINKFFTSNGGGGSPSVVQPGQQSLYPLLDWLTEKGYHLPPKTEKGAKNDE